MAQTVHLKLKIDGNDIVGESTISSMDRENTIECSSFHHGVTISRDVAEQEPVVIQKRIDKSTPLLLKALHNKEPITEAQFRFYRPAPGSSGVMEYYYTVLLEKAFISSVRQVSEDAIVGGEKAPPMMEEVTFVSKLITWTYEIGGPTYRVGDRR